MLPVLGKKAVLEWCMEEGLIGSSYVCPKYGKSMGKKERVCELHFLDNAIRRYTEGGNILGMAYYSEQAITSAYVFMIQSSFSS
ncbi:hypothetical protein TNCV_705421 [Trichonephila clavipes]|nr:hypothetical protein TNCV_705421 [Trichonephila clavipes]